MGTLKHHLGSSINMLVLDADRLVEEAVNLMHDKNQSFVILEKDKKFVGIFTNTDLQNVISENLDLSVTKLREVMSKNLVIFDINDDIDVCMALAEKNKISHLPIFNQGKLITVLSYDNVLHLALAELKLERDDLIHYINSSACNTEL